jgi:hypothetical protein
MNYRLESDSGRDAINPKSEGRRPKEIRRPKAEFIGGPEIGPLIAKGPSRVSGFGLLSDFGFRASDFAGHCARSERDPAPAPRHLDQGYLLTEALVYIGLVFLLLGIGYAAMYRAIDNSVALRGNADDILRAVHAGELWRADVRLATAGTSWDTNGDEPILRLRGTTDQINYRFVAGALYRRNGAGPWSKILDRVESSSIVRDARLTVIAWRWELELQPKATGSFKPGRVRPLFTFLAVPPAGANP